MAKTESTPDPKRRRRTPARLDLSGFEQVRALAHPLRTQLLELFAERPMTTKQAAERLGQPPTRLYHHVAALERAGLITLRETRPVRGTTEKYFAASAHLFQVPTKVATSPAKPGDHAAMGMLLFDQARQELMSALAKGSKRTTLFATRAVLRMNARGAAKLEKQLLAMMQSKPCAEEAGRKRTEPLRRYSLTIALIPTDEVGEGSSGDQSSR